MVFFSISLFILSCNGDGNEIVPKVITLEITDITTSGAIAGGNIYDAGSSPVKEHGVCWSTTPDPTTENDRTNEGPWLGPFNHRLFLAGGTTYYVRSYAINEEGTGYGETVSFRTAGDVPVATTLTYDKNAPPKITLYGLINPNLLLTTVNFEYGPTTSYGQQATISNSPTTNSGLVSVELDGLIPSQTYHYRLVAENEVGIHYGEDLTFTSEYKVGQKVGRGYIIYIDDSGLHGLIGLESYEPLYSHYFGGWTESTNAITGATGTGPGTGALNSTLILAQHGNKAIYASYIKKYTFDNVAWSMASKDELNLIYRHIFLPKFGQYATANYWSSSEIDKDSVWSQDFQTGAQIKRHKATQYHSAAAVRSF